MRAKLEEKIQVPSGVSVQVEGSVINVSKGSVKLSREISSPRLNAEAKGTELIITCESGNKIEYKKIKSLVSHLKNLIAGLENKYEYHLESCNVHFPMTLKVDKSKFVINNFLGEKQPRFADIVEGANVEVKGQKITVTSHDKEAAGQTAANIEKATKIRNRDRRIFQDGIYIISRPAGGAKI
jgi:large subunit ribosomal protein L6